MAVKVNTPHTPEDSSLATLQALADSVPTELLAKTQSAYGPMNYQTVGAFMPVMQGNKVQGYIWTDWADGAGYIGTNFDDLSTMIRAYFAASKDAGAQAGVAYTSFPAYAKSAMTGVSVGDESAGTLGTVVDLTREGVAQNGTE